MLRFEKNMSYHDKILTAVMEMGNMSQTTGQPTNTQKQQHINTNLNKNKTPLIQIYTKIITH